MASVKLGVNLRDQIQGGYTAMALKRIRPLEQALQLLVEQTYAAVFTRELFLAEAWKVSPHPHLEHSTPVEWLQRTHSGSYSMCEFSDLPIFRLKMNRLSPVEGVADLVDRSSLSDEDWEALNQSVYRSHLVAPMNINMRTVVNRAQADGLWGGDKFSYLPDNEGGVYLPPRTATDRRLEFDVLQWLHARVPVAAHAVISKQVLELMQLVQELDRVEEQVKDAIFSCSTLKQLLDAHPSMRPLVPTEQLLRHEKKVTRRKAPPKVVLPTVAPVKSAMDNASLSTTIALSVLGDSK